MKGRGFGLGGLDAPIFGLSRSRPFGHLRGANFANNGTCAHKVYAYTRCMGNAVTFDECACVGCDGEAPIESTSVRGFCARCKGCGCSFADGPRCGESWDAEPTDETIGGIPVAKLDAAAARARSRAAAVLATTTPEDDARAIARTVLQPIEDQKVAAPDAYRAIMRAIAVEAGRRSR